MRRSAANTHLEIAYGENLTQPTEEGAATVVEKNVRSLSKFWSAEVNSVGFEPKWPDQVLFELGGLIYLTPSI
jgi:hypothetical protein